MRRTTPRVCKQCGVRPVRKRRSALFCSPCVAKMAKRPCAECGKPFQPDMMSGPRCRPCASSKAHGSRIQKTYSISGERYAELLALQGGRCAICQRPMRQKRFSVDHDHACCNGPTSCGKCVRGLICSVDNKYLGYIRDNPETALRMAEYLVRPPAQQNR